MKISILVNQLKKKMGVNQALNGVDTVFAASTLHGLIGPEGAGKTTLLRTLVGLLQPNSGSIQYQVNGAGASLSAIRSSIAYMPQQQSLYPDLSIREHLDFFKELYGISDSLYESRRDELLHLTRLKPFEDRPAGKLSGGMYKKLGLMCALLRSPQALLLDEPTNGVDPISRREFWDLLYQYRNQGILIIVATAYMDEAERCEQVHLLHQGRILTEGEPKRLLLSEKAKNFDELYLKQEGLV